VSERLVLWDIDGTLIRAGAIAGEAFGRAVASVAERAEHEIEFVTMSGKTDPQIAREMLLLAAGDDVTTDSHIAAVIAHLEAELGAAEEMLRQEGRVLPGVRAILEELGRDPEVTQSVLTGNTSVNARAKLDAFGLTSFFDLDIAAFGSDDADRLRLVPVALERAEVVRGMTFDPSDVWVIGDTQHDLACARAAGARCIVVATGRPTLDELLALDADAVLPDLSDVAAVVELIRS
jgi:phosphoglycolate phosphatase-like HAD superfamily hydrolase